MTSTDSEIYLRVHEGRKTNQRQGTGRRRWEGGVKHIGLHGFVWTLWRQIWRRPGHVQLIGSRQ